MTERETYSFIDDADHSHVQGSRGILELRRDDTNVFEDSPSAILVRTEARSAFISDDEVTNGPCFVYMEGSAKAEIEFTFKLETARQLYEALGELLKA